MIENSIMVNNKVLLPNGKVVEQPLMDQVRNFIQTKSKTLPKLTPYTLKSMHDPKAWKSFDDGTRRRMGDCLSHLVATHQVPMTCLGKNSSNSLTYQYI